MEPLHMRLGRCAPGKILSRVGVWMEKDNVDELSPWIMWITWKNQQTQESGISEKGHPHMGVWKSGRPNKIIKLSTRIGYYPQFSTTYPQVCEDFFILPKKAPPSLWPTVPAFLRNHR